MGKSKSRISSTQRDKINISKAKALKKAGIISKQAKLHGGRFISRGVLNKVREYEASTDLNYKAYKVPKSVAKAAKDRGFQVVQGNKIIGPRSRQFANRLAKGELTGVRPVKGGMMEEVILPHTIYDMRTLIESLEQGGLESLKLPDEQFAFKYHGNESYRAFMNSKQLVDYLNHYKSFAHLGSQKPEDLQEEFDAFTVFRLHANDVPRNIRGPQRRAVDRKRERLEAIANGTYVAKKRNTTRYEDQINKMSDIRYRKHLEKQRLRQQAIREKRKDDPVYKAKNIARAARNRKGK